MMLARRKRIHKDKAHSTRATKTRPFGRERHVCHRTTEFYLDILYGQLYGCVWTRSLACRRVILHVATCKRLAGRADLFFTSPRLGQPPLYDIKSKEYSNRDVKAKRWVKVAEVMFKDWTDFNMKTKDEKGKIKSKYTVVHLR
ncbi:hypothetical protein J6590_088621 [Homalodisca vitripennis]|nr:hypothetical protein J6590_088621 [Homalodisca vitripennis]